jgi:colanic acid/amylovoran biosynthesis glycosyltransferase
MSSPYTLVLFTASYPYDVAVEQTFLDPEIEILSQNFDQVIVVPQNLEGNRVTLPSRVQVETSFAALGKSLAVKLRYSGMGLLSSLFYQDLFIHPTIIFLPRVLRRLVSYVSRAERTRIWVREFITNRRLDPSNSIFYTYWLDACSTGIGQAKHDFGQIRLVSRAHSIDLYEERHDPPYIPCRNRTLEGLDLLCPDSENGVKHIIKRFPWFASRCELSRQGVDAPGFVTDGSRDGVFRIVSCSYMIPRKRIGLLLSGIERVARLRPEQKFEWNHIGEGPLRKTIEDTANATLPTNAAFHILGYLPPQQMMAFYKENPIDVFVNVSDNEGTPVSLMEAASCWMPIIATAVGGNVEIVSDKNGVLLDSNPSPVQVANAMLRILENPGLAAQMRKGSHQVWQEKYNAPQNFQDFVEHLKDIRTQS